MFRQRRLITPPVCNLPLYRFNRRWFPNSPTRQSATEASGRAGCVEVCRLGGRRKGSHGKVHTGFINLHRRRLRGQVPGSCCARGERSAVYITPRGRRERKWTEPSSWLCVERRVAAGSPCYALACGCSHHPSLWYCVHTSRRHGRRHQAACHPRLSGQPGKVGKPQRPFDGGKTMSRRTDRGVGIILLIRGVWESSGLRGSMGVTCGMGVPTRGCVVRVLACEIDNRVGGSGLVARDTGLSPSSVFRSRGLVHHSVGESNAADVQTRKHDVQTESN